MYNSIGFNKCRESHIHNYSTTKNSPITLKIDLCVLFVVNHFPSPSFVILISEMIEKQSTKIKNHDYSQNKT